MAKHSTHRIKKSHNGNLHDSRSTHSHSSSMQPEKRLARIGNSLTEFTDRQRSRYSVRQNLLRKALGGTALGVGVILFPFVATSQLSQVQSPTFNPNASLNSKPNFDPIIGNKGSLPHDIVQSAGQSIVGSIVEPEVVGYGQQTGNPEILKLIYGAKIIPRPNGELDIYPLHGQDEVRLSRQVLANGSTIGMGDGYTLTIGSDSQNHQIFTFSPPA